MTEIIELGKIQRQIIQSSSNEPIMIRAISFLRTYGLKFIDTDIIQSAIFQGGRTMEDLASFYLNWILEKRFGGMDLAIRGSSTEEVVDKFIGIHFFKYEGNGPLRWAIKKINQGRFKNFQQAWQKINQDDRPGGGLFIVRDLKGNRFVFDPLAQNFRRRKFRVGRCWAYRDGREFFLVNDGQENFFIPYKGQSSLEALKSLEKTF